MPRSIAAVILSAFLLVISYPQMELWPLAWIALVPFFIILRNKNYWPCFGYAYLLGFIFFGGTLGWFIYVTYPGAFLLIAYLSLYVAVFGLCYRFLLPSVLWLRVFVLPCAWVILEFIRAHALSGFGWALLGHSQTSNTLMIQIADITGVYGVSYLVLMVNLLIAESIMLVMPEGRSTEVIRGDKELFKVVIIVIFILFSVLAYGFITIWKAPVWPRTRVAVVQPNIPQAIKWEERLQPWIIQQTADLTVKLKALQPDVLIWPETSLPGVVSEVPFLVGQIKLTAVKAQAPVLMGAITDEKGTYFNSAYLISEKGKIVNRYDKIHLVPFGEYLPLRPVLGWISRYVPLEDFTSGKEYTIMSTKQKHPFGVLICFEDTVSYLRRKFVKEGAQFLVNMTNDAWFMDTKAPFIHLQAAIFGSVENKRSLVRAANTGFSGMIDPFGRILSSVNNSAHKRTFIAGTAVADIPLVTGLTFYTKYGDIFTWLCFFAILWVITRRLYEKNLGH